MANSLITYLKDARAELKKVQWPSRPEVVRGTIVVIAISLGTAVFLGAVDYLLNFVLEILI
jgi:preprotein translocase subunit SecE